MGYTYEWKIVGLKKGNNTDCNLDNVIIGTQWKVKCTDEDGVSGEFMGATPFDLKSVDPDNFTPYESLTESQVLVWIKNHVSGSQPTNYWDHIQGRIDREILGKKASITNVMTDDLPWSSTSGSIERPIPA